MTRYAPLWQQAGSYPAQLDRGLMSALWPSGGASGAAPVAVNNTMTVSIPPGSVAVPLQSGQGAALCRWDVAEVVTLGAAPGSGTSRIDVIVAQVRDNAIDAGANNDWIFAVVAGTPAASNPAVPATPANAYPVVNVTVPGAVANLNTATVTDRRAPLVPLTNPYVARMYRAAAVAGQNGSYVLPFDSVSYDPHGDLKGVGTAVPYYAPPTAGRYLVTARCSTVNTGAQMRSFMSIMKTGAEFSRGQDSYAPASVPLGAVITDIVPAVPGDTIYIQNYATTLNAYDVGSPYMYASFALLAWP